MSPSGWWMPNLQEPISFRPWASRTWRHLCPGGCDDGPRGPCDLVCRPARCLCPTRLLRDEHRSGSRSNTGIGRDRHLRQSRRVFLDLLKVPELLVLRGCAWGCAFDQHRGLFGQRRGRHLQRVDRCTGTLPSQHDDGGLGGERRANPGKRGRARLGL